MENQSIFWLPWNSISSELYYNQRIIVSMPMLKPITYQISKVENTVPKGVNKFTLYQGEFNEHTDYVNLETGEMYADYYEKKTDIIEEDPKDLPVMTDEMELSCALAQIKVGGGYKSLTATIFNKDKEDVTSKYLNYKWSYYIDDINVSDLITEIISTDINKIKIKFNGNEDYLDKVLTVKCYADSLFSEIQLDIISL